MPEGGEPGAPVPGPAPIELAGIKPLPINRMLRQAGRKANQFYTRGDYVETNVPNAHRKDGTLHLFRAGTTSHAGKGEGRASQTQIDRATGQNLADETMERLERAQDAINSWDPIEASAQEDYNRLKGKMGPADAVELIQPIAPLDGEIREAGTFPQV